MAKEKRIVFEAHAEDLRDMGGPMGAETTTTLSLAFCASLQKAKEVCTNHYRIASRNKKATLYFRQLTPKCWETKDLIFVRYHIALREVQ